MSPGAGDPTRGARTTVVSKHAAFFAFPARGTEVPDAALVPWKRSGELCPYRFTHGEVAQVEELFGGAGGLGGRTTLIRAGEEPGQVMRQGLAAAGSLDEAGPSLGLPTAG